MKIREKYKPVDAPPADEGHSPDEPAGGSTMTPPLSHTDSDMIKDMDDIDLAYNILQNKIQKCGRTNGRADIVRRVIGYAVGEIKILIGTKEKN